MKCLSIKQNKTDCKCQAKYVDLNNNYYVCGRHAVQYVNATFNKKYKRIEDIIELHFIKTRRVSTSELANIVVEDINQHHELNFELDSMVEEYMYQEYWRVFYNGESFILLIAKQNKITDMYDAMNIQIKYQHLNLFIPISLYCSEGINVYLAAINQRRNVFYQVNHHYECIKNINWTYDHLNLFIQRLLDIIHTLHKNRMCIGELSSITLCIKDINDMNTTFIQSADFVSFWISARGDYIEEDETHNGPFDVITCSRQVQTNHSPSRRDDYESLIYLIIVLAKKEIPWKCNMANSKILQLKQQFLEDSNQFITSDCLSQLTKRLINMHHDEMPNYDIIENTINQFLLSLKN